MSAERDALVMVQMALEQHGHGPAVSEMRIAGNGPTIGQVIERALATPPTEVQARLQALALAAIRYDAAIQSCAGDPARMASFCSAEGDDLDELYADWIAKARESLTPTCSCERGKCNGPPGVVCAISLFMVEARR